MENSHRRIIAELEEKHHRELRTLEAEKQQALAEETQVRRPGHTGSQGQRQGHRSGNGVTGH